MSRFLISCGGTGGHLSPGIALAEALQARGHHVILLISRKRVDARLSEKYPHLRFVSIPGAGFAWDPFAMLRFVWLQLQGLMVSMTLVRRERPDVVIGFGGFTSGSFILAGALMGVPVVLHEANRVPGRAIRRLGRFARRVYLPTGVTIVGMRASALRDAGLPVRKEFRHTSPERARTALGLEAGARTLVVLGGSQGASALNDWSRREMPVLAAEGIQLYCVTGLGKGDSETIDLKARGGAPVRAIFTPFCDRMPELLSAATLVVSRAGAGTISELVRMEVPAILVPYPQAADNHQAANARYFKEQGGGRVVDQTRMSELSRLALELTVDDRRLDQFREGLRQMNRADPLAVMVGDLEALAGDGGETSPVTKGAAIGSA